MALDEAILESVASRNVPPTIRLYSWLPPCLSLGYAQPLSQVDVHRIRELGWDIVRRPTGGRALLHADELTYSVTAPLDNPDFSRGVLDSYRHISKGLVTALELLHLPVEIQPEIHLGDDERQQPICFEIPSSYEITVGGKKLLGSAQVRRKRGVLQHGSLPLSGDITRVCKVLVFDDEMQRDQAASRLSRRATTIEQILGRSIAWQEAADIVVEGFRRALALHLEIREPEKEELERARELREERYECKAWLERI
jgi:lipoate-protein ligase A